MRSGWPGWAAAGAAFGLGAIMASGQAPLGFWWLTLAALATLTVLVASAPGPKHTAWLGFFAGTGYFILALSWLTQPFLIDAERYAWMAPFAVLFMSAGLALFWAAAAGLSTVFSGSRRAMAFVLALTAAEFARGHVLTGFPWALVGHVWIGTAPAQVASLLGPTGLTLMTTIAAALPAAFRWRGLAASALILALATGFGTWRLSQPDPGGRALTVRLVQPNADQQAKWDPERAQANFARLLDLTSTAPRPDLVIWPETSVPYLLDTNPDLPEIIAGAAGGATTIVGVQRSEGMRAWNSAVVIAPDGQISAVYDKHHLVPFGEYIPKGDLAYSLFGLTAFAAQQGNGYSSGTGPSILELGPDIGRVLPLICYEAVFPQDLLDAPGRADWLLQITNDAWFGTLSGPYQHLAQARLRAIEQGLPMIRVANTGVSAAIDAKGRVLASIPLGRADFLDVPLPGALPITPFARYGEAPALLLLAVLALGFLIPLHRRRP